MPNYFSDLGAGTVFGPQRAIDIKFTYIPEATERVARNLRGRFTSAQVEIGQAMETLAIRLQEAQAAALQQVIEEGGREQRDTHYLEDAILSPANRIVTGDGFVVGVESAFDESPAGPYWRGLEEGTAVHVGQRMYGLWLTAVGDLSAPVEGGRDAVGFVGWRHIDPYTKQEYRDEESGKLPGFRIGRPIIGRHYLSRGIDEFLESGAIQEEMAAAIARALQVQETAIARGITTQEVRAGR